SSLVGGLEGLFILGQLSWVLILAGVVPHFFCGATAGVFGYAMGGRRGAILGAYAHGILITFLYVFLLPVLESLVFSDTTVSDAEFGVIGIILGNMANYWDKNIITVVIVGLFAVLVAYNYLKKEKINH